MRWKMNASKIFRAQPEFDIKFTCNRNFNEICSKQACEFEIDALDSLRLIFIFMKKLNFIERKKNLANFRLITIFTTMSEFLSQDR